LADEHVTRHNYAPTKLATVRTALLEIIDDVQLRAGAATLAAVVAVIATAVAVELHRLTALEAEVATMNDRVAQNAAGVARLTTVRKDVERLRLLDDALLDSRAAARDDVNALVLIGNRLPSDTWLLRVHGDRDGSWTIDGRTSRMFAIGKALLEVERLRPDARVRLLSVTSGDVHAHSLRFSLAWERVVP
jgi:hypothetical protein